MRTHAYQAQKQGVDAPPPKSSLPLRGAGKSWPRTEPSVYQTRRCYYPYPTPVQSSSLSWTVGRHSERDLASRNWHLSVIIQFTTWPHDHMTTWPTAFTAYYYRGYSDETRDKPLVLYHQINLLSKVPDKNNRIWPYSTAVDDVAW